MGVSIFVRVGMPEVLVMVMMIAMDMVSIMIVVGGFRI